MIAVTGASGKLGRLAVEELLKRAPSSQVIALARDPSRLSELAERGVAVRRADYADPSTLATALVGVKRLLLVSGTDMLHRLEHHIAVVTAARAAQVELLGYTSVLRADTTQLAVAPDHKATEEVIRRSGIPFVLLRNGWYIENYLDHVARALAHGAFLGSARDGRIAGASRRDYAAAAAAVLTQPGHAGRTYELAGDTSFSLAELARAVSSWAGRPVTYRDLPPSELAQVLAQSGLPPFVADLLAAVDIAISNGALESDSRDLSGLIGRPTETVSDVLGRLPRVEI